MTDVVTAEHMICQLAQVCDRASAVDGAGFSRYDADFGHKMAEIAKQNRAWTENQASVVLKLLQKYQAQLGGQEFINNWLKNPVFKNTPIKNTKNKNKRRIYSRDKTAFFEFEYNNEIISKIKVIKGDHKGVKFRATWDSSNKIWSVPVNPVSIGAIIAIAEEYNFEIEDRFKIYAEKIQEQVIESKTMLILNSNQHITVVDDIIQVSVNDISILEEIKHECSNA